MYAELKSRLGSLKGNVGRSVDIRNLLASWPDEVVLVAKQTFPATTQMMPI